jgi:serine/threonine protein kinase
MFDHKPDNSELKRDVSGLGAESQDFKAGHIIGGSYKIEGVLGRGGMGVVYLAEHTVFQRQVAVKVLAPDRQSEENWQRFQAEGKAIARMDHPNIVKVYDMGTDGPGCLYYVMDLLRGLSLAEMLRKRGVPNLAESLEIFGQICAGLDYAHRQGLVHRDIKPSNIFLCPVAGSNKPLVKIIDYGLVKLASSDSQMTQSLTTADRVCGSPLYMSPEQWLSRPIDKRSDIYSLGCTLFECLTGEPPFVADNTLAVALMHQNQEPPRLKDGHGGLGDRDYPESLELLVNRMLQKQPAQRHQSMAQVAQDILRVKAGKSVTREPIFADGPLYQIDQDAEAKLEAPGRTTRMPLIWMLALGAVATLFAGWASYSYFFANKENMRTSKILIGTSSNPDVIIGRKESPEMKEAREVFAKCPQISNGVINRDGTACRVFNFPSVGLGYVRWHNDDVRRPAQGEVVVPAAERVTLEVCRGEGDMARLYPGVLSKIGPDDIYALEVREPAKMLDESVLSFELPVQLVQAISKWKAIRVIDFYHCKVSSQALLALNSFNTMKELRLRDSLVDGQDLAKVKWLKDIEYLDIKGIKNVDPVLEKLAGSSNLRSLNIDLSVPSIANLKGLASCKNLEQLTVRDGELDLKKIAAIGEISSLRALSLNGCNVTAQSIPDLARLKKLDSLDLVMVPMEPADAEKLARLLPHCRLRYERMRAPKLGDY